MRYLVMVHQFQQWLLFLNLVPFAISWITLIRPAFQRIQTSTIVTLFICWKKLLRKSCDDLSTWVVEVEQTPSQWKYN